MKIAIRNNQKKFKVDKSLRDLVRSAAKETLLYMDFSTKVEISVMFTDNQEIKELNVSKGHAIFEYKPVSLDSLNITAIYDENFNIYCEVFKEIFGGDINE